MRNKKAPFPWKKLFSCLIILFIVVLIASPLFARAGGAGASSSGGYSGSSSFSTHSYSGTSSGADFFIVQMLISLIINGLEWLFIVLGPLPASLILIGIFALIFWGVKNRNKVRRSVFNYLEDFDPQIQDKTWQIPADGEKFLTTFQKEHPDFSYTAFLEKVEYAFRAIQKAWSEQNLDSVRRFISDGVYQRFNTQFQMMQLLRQKNHLSNIKIHQLKAVSYQTDGPFDVLEVKIRASMYDRFESALDFKLNQEGNDSFTEYWSFIRRKDVRNEALDIYQNTLCPHCGSPLPLDLGERGQCPYCSSLVNSGEFDWVLAEITQEEDYAADQALLRGLNYGTLLKNIRKKDAEFCVQLAEDKASNAFMQLLRAKAQAKPELARRFVSDELFTELETQAKSEQGSNTLLVYNRLFLNRVLLLSSHEAQAWEYLDFLITFSRQRVYLKAGRTQTLDPVLREEQLVLRMKRKNTDQKPKGNLYLHQCSSCGAPIQDSTDLSCPYCSTLYNSGDYEWICESLIPRAAYKASEIKSASRHYFDPALLDDLYEVKDFAVNNLILIAAADGVFSPEEKEALEEAIQQYRYPVANLEALFALARAGQLRARMPSDYNKRIKILEMMQKMAESDGNVSPEEEQILQAFRTEYL